MVTLPTFQIREYSIGTDPSGNRNGSGGGFLGLRSTTVGETLRFNPIDITTSGNISEAHIILGRVSAFGDASGVYNLRFFLVSTAAWSGGGTYRFLEFTNRHFQSNKQLFESDVDSLTSVPPTQNWFNTYGGAALSGTKEDDVTQYRWLAVLAGSDVPVGTKGHAGNGGFVYRTLYQFS